MFIISKPGKSLFSVLVIVSIEIQLNDNVGTSRMFDKIDAHARTYWYIWLFNRWMAIRLNLMGALFAILVAAVVVFIKDIDAALAGFALSFALQYGTAIVSSGWTVQFLFISHFAVKADSAVDLDD